MQNHIWQHIENVLFFYFQLQNILSYWLQNDVQCFEKNHVQWVFLCHQFNLSTSFTQGALNVVMGNAPEIGDALLRSTQVLFPPILSSISISISFFFVNRSHRNYCVWHYSIMYFLLGQEDYVHWSTVVAQMESGPKWRD
jgi:hypothetical protein